MAVVGGSTAVGCGLGPGVTHPVEGVAAEPGLRHILELLGRSVASVRRQVPFVADPVALIG